MLIRAWLFLGLIVAILSLAGSSTLLTQAGWHSGDPTLGRRIAPGESVTVARAHAPSEHQHITRGAILKRVLAVTVSGLALYGLAPKLGEVLGAWPRLRDIQPGWFAVMAATETASLVCMCAVQRIATQEHRWAPFLHSYLVGNAVSELVPGGAATSAALQYEMLVHEGVPPDRAAAGMAAGSVIVFGTLLVLNVLALPLVVLGVSVPTSLLAAAWISAVLLLGIVLIGSLALRGDRFLIAVGRAAQWALNKLRRHSQPVQDLPKRPLVPRTAAAGGFGQPLVAGAAGGSRQMGVRLPHVRLRSRRRGRAPWTLRA